MALHTVASSALEVLFTTSGVGHLAWYSHEAEGTRQSGARSAVRASWQLLGARGCGWMKRPLLALSIVMVVGFMSLLPANAWGAEAQHVYAWGDPWSSSISSLQYYGATSVGGIPGRVVQISTSNSVSYTLTGSGEVWAWGAGQFGALGNGTAPASMSTPVQVKFPMGVKITSLPTPMPYDSGMAIDSSGHIWGWGSNVGKSLCIPKSNLVYPEKLPLAHVTMASGAGVHALYLSNGKLYACGGNTAGELGDGTTVASMDPVPVVGLPDRSVRSIVSSWEDSGAVMADGYFYAWGYNNSDQLGDGTTKNSDTPVQVHLPAKVRQLSMGGDYAADGQTVAILTNGSVWAWGADRWGQLGNGEVSSSSGPTRVDVPPRVTFVQVVSGGPTMYAIDSSGAVWAWGHNNQGQFGFGSLVLSDVPVRVGIDLSCLSSTAANVEGLREPDAGSTQAGGGLHGGRSDRSALRLAAQESQCVP